MSGTGAARNSSFRLVLSLRAIWFSLLPLFWFPTLSALPELSLQVTVALASLALQPYYVSGLVNSLLNSETQAREPDWRISSVPRRPVHRSPSRPYGWLLLGQGPDLCPVSDGGGRAGQWGLHGRKCGQEAVSLESAVGPLATTRPVWDSPSPLFLAYNFQSSKLQVSASPLDSKLPLSSKSLLLGLGNCSANGKKTPISLTHLAQ